MGVRPSLLGLLIFGVVKSAYEVSDYWSFRRIMSVELDDGHAGPVILARPALDLVELRGAGRAEVQMGARMLPGASDNRPITLPVAIRVARIVTLSARRCLSLRRPVDRIQPSGID